MFTCTFFNSFGGFIEVNSFVLIHCNSLFVTSFFVKCNGHRVAVYLYAPCNIGFARLFEKEVHSDTICCKLYENIENELVKCLTNE